MEQFGVDPERVIPKLQEMISGMSLELAAMRVAVEDAQSELRDLRAILASKSENTQDFA